MALKLNKSFIPEKVVKDKIHQTYQAFEHFTGRKPNEKERENLKNKVVDVAKRLERDRGMK